MTIPGSMTMLVVLVSGAAAAELARLGVTSVALLRGDQTVGFVVEDWALDSSRSARVLSGAGSPCSAAR